MTTLRDVEKKPFGNRVALVLLTVVAVAACVADLHKTRQLALRPLTTWLRPDALRQPPKLLSKMSSQQLKMQNLQTSMSILRIKRVRPETFACQFLVEISESGSLDEIFGLSCGGRSENLSDGCALDYSEERKAFFQATRAACSDEDLLHATSSTTCRLKDPLMSFSDQHAVSVRRSPSGTALQILLESTQ